MDMKMDTDMDMNTDIDMHLYVEFGMSMVYVHV